MQINIGEGIPHDLKKILGKKCIFLIHLNEFNLKDGFENYLIAKIFHEPSNDKKVWKIIYIYIYIHNPICYINSFATLFLN